MLQRGIAVSVTARRDRLGRPLRKLGDIPPPVADQLDNLSADAVGLAALGFTAERFVEIARCAIVSQDPEAARRAWQVSAALCGLAPDA